MICLHNGLLSFSATFCDKLPCKNGGLCRNQEDGYSCTCIDGYHGNECLCMLLLSNFIVPMFSSYV